MSKNKKNKADDKSKKALRRGKVKAGKKGATTGPLARLSALTKGQTVAGAALLASIGLTYWAQRRRSRTPQPTDTSSSSAAGAAL